IALAFGAAIEVVPRLLRQIDWLSQAPELERIARHAFALLAAAAVSAFFVSRTRPAAAAAALGAGVVAAMPYVYAGLVAIAPIDSSKPIAEVIASFTEDPPDGVDDVVVYEAPAEYQSCAGLNFYLGRRIELLRPTGFVEPPYLTAHREQLFIER